MSETGTIERLLFVYNASSGAFAAIVDSAKKFFRLNGCALCSLTHSLAGEREEWKSCREAIGVAIDYVHRDELTGAMQRAIGNEPLPCIVAVADSRMVLLLRSSVIQRCNGSIADFLGRLNVHAAMQELRLPAR